MVNARDRLVHERFTKSSPICWLRWLVLSLAVSVSGSPSFGACGWVQRVQIGG